MERLVPESLWSNSRFRRRTWESLRGALHLIFFDTSPLKGFMQMCTKRTFVHSVNCVTYQALLFCLCTLVHMLCTLRTQHWQ